MLVFRVIEKNYISNVFYSIIMVLYYNKGFQWFFISIFRCHSINFQNKIFKFLFCVKKIKAVLNLNINIKKMIRNE